MRLRGAGGLGAPTFIRLRASGDGACRLPAARHPSPRRRECPRPSSSTASGMVSGASRRTTFAAVPQDKRIRPRCLGARQYRRGQLPRPAPCVFGSLTSSKATIAPRPRTSPMRAAPWRAPPDGCAFCLPTRGRARAQPLGLDHIEHRVRRRDADRIAAVGAAESAGMRRIHDRRAAGHARQREGRRPDPWPRR